MPISPEQRQIIAMFFETKRKIISIENAALEKVRTKIDTAKKGTCSFCTKPESNTTFLIPGADGASICTDCVNDLTHIFKDNG